MSLEHDVVFTPTSPCDARRPPQFILEGILDRLRAEARQKFPEKVTAFRCFSGFSVSMALDSYFEVERQKIAYNNSYYNEIPRGGNH